MTHDTLCALLVVVIIFLLLFLLTDAPVDLYRQGPCPDGSDVSCVDINGPPYFSVDDLNGTAANFLPGYWGDNLYGWWADFFYPSRFLMQTSPLLAIRGNHENCDRAGHGYFLFLAQEEYPPEMLAGHHCTGYSHPYAVPFDNEQFLVMDDSLIDPLNGGFDHFDYGTSCSVYMAWTRLAHNANTASLLPKRPLPHKKQSRMLAQDPQAPGRHPLLLKRKVVSKIKKKVRYWNKLPTTQPTWNNWSCFRNRTIPIFTHLIVPCSPWLATMKPWSHWIGRCKNRWESIL